MPPPIPTPPITVPVRAMLGTMGTDNFPSGSVVQELETGSCWLIQDGVKPVGSTSVTAINCAPSDDGVSPTRHFARMKGVAFDSYKYQPNWCVAPSTGSDVATGVDSDNALASTEELRQRIFGDQRADMLVTIFGNTTECYREFDSDYLMAFVGEIASTAFTASAATKYDASSGVNESGTVTDGAVIDWNTYKGKFIFSGAIYATVLKDQTANKARLGQWLDNSGTPEQNAPAPGAFAIATLPIITVKATAAGGFDATTPERNVTYSKVQRNLVAGDIISGKYTLCQFNFGGGFVPVSVGLASAFVGCSFHSSGTGAMIVKEETSFYGSSFLNIFCAAGPNGAADGSGCTFQGGSFSDSIESTGVTIPGGTIYAYRGSLSVFDAPGAGVNIQCGKFGFGGAFSLFGKGNLLGFGSGVGAYSRIASTVTPTLTGTTEMSMSGTPFPKFVPGDATPVPATSALATWANLIAAPYSRYAQDTRGSIIDAAA